MKAYIFTSYYYPHVGGVERYVMGLTKYLGKHGIKSVVITCNTNAVGRSEKYHGVGIMRLDCWHILNGTYPVPKLNKNNIRLIFGIETSCDDVIITNTRFSVVNLFAFIVRKKNGIKLIHIEHGNSHVTPPGLMARILFHMADHALGRLVATRSSLCIAISRRGKEFIRHIGARKVVYIPNSLDMEEWLPSRGSKRKHQVIYVGRISSDKGLEYLIGGFKAFNNGKYKLLIVGEGAYRKTIEQACLENIYFLGNKNVNQIRILLSQSEVFVNPSLREGLPTSVLEAVSQYTPVIATDVGGTCDIISRKSGYLIEKKSSEAIAQSLYQIVNDRKSAHRRARQAYKNLVDNFSWERNIKKIIKLLIAKLND